MPSAASWLVPPPEASAVLPDVLLAELPDAHPAVTAIANIAADAAAIYLFFIMLFLSFIIHFTGSAAGRSASVCPLSVFIVACLFSIKQYKFSDIIGEFLHDAQNTVFFI